LIVDNDGLRPAREVAGNINLPKGLRTIRVAYFEGYGGESLEVYWRVQELTKN